MPVCPQCPGRYFINDDALRSHTKARKHGAHTCGQCGKGFASQQGLEQHTSDKHTTFECHYCSREFKTEDGRSAHERAVHPPTFECHYCDREFKTEDGRSAHERAVHPSTFECEYCDREFSTDEGRLMHQKVKHPLFACGQCSREFNTAESLEQHKEAKHPTYQWHHLNGRFTAVVDSNDHEEEEEEDPPTFECGLCYFESTYEAALREHEKDRHPGSLGCPFCARLFADVEASWQHARSEHPTQAAASRARQVHCSYCSLGYATQGAKDAHEQHCASNPATVAWRARVSSGSTLPVADEQGSTDTESTDDGQESTISPSRASYSTVDEEVFHSPKQVPFADALGEETTPNSTASACVVRQADKLVPDDGDSIILGRKDARFQCTPCLVLFETEEALRDHVCPSRTAMVRLHCSLCFEEFKDRPSLQQHLESPLTCHLCPVRCCSAEALQTHLLAHPTCGKCHQSFSDEISLSMHVVSAHPVVVCWDCDGAVVEVCDLESHYRESPVHPTCAACGLGQKDAAVLDEHVERVHATAEIEVDTGHADVIIDPDACEDRTSGEDRETVPLEQPDRVPTPSLDEQETPHVVPISQPSAPSEAKDMTEARASDTGTRDQASPSPTPSEHGSDASGPHSSVTTHDPAANESIRPEPFSPASSATSASFSDSATSDENSVVFVSAEAIPEYVTENRAVLVATSARGRPLRLPSESSLASLDSSAGGRASTIGTYRLHCRICLRDPCEDMTVTICGHLFCKRCITQAVVAKSECPVCQSATLLYCLFKLDLSA